MSLQTRLSDFITRLGTEFKAVRIMISGSGTGDVSGLTTTATDLVGAINELNTAAGALINDVTPSATTVYSSNKTDAQIAAAVTNLVNGAPGALDTLNELSAALGNDANYATTVTNALALKANAADVYTQAELGDPETDLVALFNAAIL